jgi:arylsulfatase A-like enzyme
MNGSPVPPSVEGQNVFTSSREAVYLAYRDLHRGVRTRQHKLIEYVVNGQHTVTQVFDLMADPLETRNLADDTALVETLRRQLFRLRDEWDDRASPWGQTFWNGFDN